VRGYALTKKSCVMRSARIFAASSSHASPVRVLRLIERLACARTALARGQEHGQQVHRLDALVGEVE